MVTTTGPLALYGENPVLTLYAPEDGAVVAVAGYWRCLHSPHGAGEALLLWLDPMRAGSGGAAPHAIYSDNLPMARYIVETFNQHFPEFRDFDFGALAPQAAALAQLARGGDEQRVVCRHAGGVIELAWAEPLARRLIRWADFPCGPQRFDLTTIICPCAVATLRVDGLLIDGLPRVERDADPPQSSAFMAFCESWVGPLVVSPEASGA